MYDQITYQDIDDEYFHDIAIIGVKYHGINDHVRLGMGKMSDKPPAIIVVSPTKDRFDVDDALILKYPEFNIDHACVADWFTDDMIERLTHWVSLNYDLLEQYNFDNDDEFNSMNVSKLLNSFVPVN